jgi:pimeloyl-ACP methyl ester carboxylesterase
MPGYGVSSMDPPHPVDLGTQGGLFAHLLIEWGLEKPHIAAHDFGGAVALRARLLHGARYSSLCLDDDLAMLVEPCTGEVTSGRRRSTARSPRPTCASRTR